jgi:hypothetical protein
MKAGKTRPTLLSDLIFKTISLWGEINPLWEAHVRAQSWVLNSAATVIATSAIVVVSAQNPQKQLLEKSADMSARPSRRKTSAK